MQWGDPQRLKTLEEVAAQAVTEEDVPKALRNRPHLTQWQRYFWDAYQTIASSRNFHSAGIASIPLTEIFTYFQIYNIHDLEMRDLYLQHIQTLDNTYLEHVNKK